MVSRRPSAAGQLDSQPEGIAAAARPSIGGRYDVQSELGRGGMACVYHAVDRATGREVALKQLVAASDAKRAAETAALFEREFHTLTQLSHPRVIRVYDYGIDPEGPYYTMELLDGGDLRERSPLPWREACELIFDVCSSLALLHSRRLVHRDVSPRNVRCTRDGHAKLIDFGAMVPMGASAHLVGTAPFVAPEALHGSAMDARTDLFSLGSTLYFALTGRLAFPARDFSQLLEVWTNKPAPPSAAAVEIPPALDQLVLSMISLEPALRPRSAFEVMQRLATVANIQREESIDVSNAYLVTPGLIARKELLAAFREHVQRAQHGRGRAVLFDAVAGAGRTRMLDACVLEAKMLGACVLRANAAGGSGRGFAAAAALATQVVELLPEAAISAARAGGVFDLLFGPAGPALEAPAGAANDTRVALRSFDRSPSEQLKLQRALLRWFLFVSKRRPLVIAVDEVDRIDEPSIAILAALADRARRHAVVLVASSERHERSELEPGHQALKERCEVLDLRALDVAETESLLGSVFGDVPNLALVSARIHAIARGNPRQTMMLAQHLVDDRLIRYDGGTWSLPPRLTAADLPASTDDAYGARVAALPPLARRLFLARALADEDAFTRDAYRLLVPDEASAQLDAALDQLLAQQLLTSDGRAYMVAQRTAADLVCTALDPAERRDVHRLLAELYERTERPSFLIARHWLLAHEYPRAFEHLLPLLRANHDRVTLTSSSQLSVSEIGRTLSFAFAAACEQGRPVLEQLDLRQWLTLFSVVDDEALYWRAAPGWREQLEHDSGLSEWRKLADVEDAGQRLMTALQRAAQRHGETPADQRGYPPDQAIRLLVHYVAISIAIGARTLDSGLLLSLPQLLEPFAPLSPLVHAIWQNALATRESTCFRQYERSQARWRKVYEDLAGVTQDPQIVSSIRYAIAFGIGLSEASLGLESANGWLEILDQDPLQKVSAMYLRKVIRLQQGDLEGAERYRKQAELLALQSNARQMFTNVLTLEIGVHYAAWDLTGVRQIAASIEPLAERHAGWRPFRHLAEGHYQRLAGDLSLARQAYERCLALSTPDPSDPNRSIVAWPLATAAYVETLVELDRAAEAKTLAERTLAECEQLGMGTAALDIARALALAEAKLGDHAAAVARLDAMIERQRSLGVTGLLIGSSYETRARVAIWAGDRPAVERYARLTADQYRHGRGSSLGARYERLMEEARGSGVVVLPPMSPFETTMFGNTETGARVSAIATIAKTMAGAVDGMVRAQRALELMCESRGARAGHLFLASESELRLAASRSLDRPDDVLDRLVSDFWAHQFDDLDPDTAPASDGTSLYSAQTWTDRRGTTYQPVLVTGKLNGAIVNAGVALLVPGESPGDVAGSIPLFAELAGYLVRSGDSRVENR